MDKKDKESKGQYAWHIVDWDRFEVNWNHRPYKKGDRKRSTPPGWIPVTREVWAKTVRKIKKVAGPGQAVGPIVVFWWMVLIGAGQRAKYRGRLLDEKLNTLGERELADLLELEIEGLKNCLAILVEAGLMEVKFCPGAGGKAVSYAVKSCELRCEKLKSHRGPNLITEIPKDSLKDKYNSNNHTGGLSVTQRDEFDGRLTEGYDSVGLPGPGPGDSGLGGSVVRDSEVSGLGDSVIRDSVGAGARQSGEAALSLNDKKDDFSPDKGLFKEEEFWPYFEEFLDHGDKEYMNPRNLLRVGKLRGVELTREFFIKTAQKWFCRLFPEIMKAQNLQGRSDRTTILGDAEREGMFEKAYKWKGPEGIFTAISLAQKAKRKTRDPNPLKNPMGYFVKQIKEMIGEPIRGP